ncbi:cell division protein FtsL [Metabacillus crassostreae]|uniref:cell division protein FtsL n=1 Tax=Metabacillus crassostreae TaxID=929098 RepID=UPI00195D7D70|nr:cell division protein FtsL [Metabacillus crassostreae]MBM7603431.1 cell division protein FtsL [Metabacillus crassostreae]
MSNLARKIEQQRQEQHQHQPNTEPIIIKRRASITLGEKFLVILLIGLFVIGAVKIVSSSYTIYQTNVDIQKMEAKIYEQTKLNSDLHVQVEELSTYERIWEKAKSLGLTLDQNSVKTVQD